MSTSASSSLFTGSSQFAADLAQVITRSVSIASLPITQLNNSLSTLQSKSSALSSLDQKVATLQSAATNIQSALNSGLVSASTSTSGIVSPTLQANASAGTYSIEVVSTGSYSTALSQAASTPVTDPATQSLSASSDFALSVDGVTTTIHNSGTSLNSLVDAINSQSNGSVQATIVNVGGSASPDYRLSFQANKLGAVSIGLADSNNNDLISVQTQGSLASYKINGITTAVTSDSRTVKLAPGLQVQLLAASTPGTATTITVAPDSSRLQSAFANLAAAYNSVVDELATHHGTNGGALQGDSILNSVSSTLQRLATYSAGTPDASLAAFGITLDSSGHLSVDGSTFQSAASSNFSGLLSLIGSKTTGGFLNSALNALNGLEDPTSGALKLQETQVTGAITKTQTSITNKQSQINQLQTNLQQQMAKADASIASLEQQVTYLTGLFTAERSYNNQNQ